MATLDDDNTNYARNSDKGDFLVAGTPLCWSPTGFLISDTTLAEQQAELQRVRREAADAKHAASILHKKLQQEQARNNTYSEVLNAFIPIAEALGLGPQLTAEVAQKALAVIQANKDEDEQFDFTKPFKGAAPKSSPIADAARKYKLKPGEQWAIRQAPDAYWYCGKTPWFDNLTWEYKLSVGKCGDCGRKECTPTCNAATSRAQELVPLEMADIQPGSTIAHNPGRRCQIIAWGYKGVELSLYEQIQEVSYKSLFEDKEALINIGRECGADGKLVWKPCSKPKQN